MQARRKMSKSESHKGSKLANAQAPDAAVYLSNQSKQKRLKADTKLAGKSLAAMKFLEAGEMDGSFKTFRSTWQLWLATYRFSVIGTLSCFALCKLKRWRVSDESDWIRHSMNEPRSGDAHSGCKL